MHVASAPSTLGSCLLLDRVSLLLMDCRKLVLVSYNNSNKVVKLPDIETKAELSYLVKEC